MCLPPKRGTAQETTLAKGTEALKIDAPLRDSRTGGQLYIGTSGWRYATWRGDFYPKGLVQRRELEHLAGRLNSVELNGSFYSLQKPTSYESWRAQTPNGFRFAVKGSRYITHMVGPDKLHAGLERFFDSGPLLLGDRLGPFIWQFPKTRRFDPQRLEGFCAALPRRRDGRTLQHAIEARHETFTDPGCVEILRRHSIALVASDGAGQWPQLAEAATAGTTDFVYVRLHGPHELYHGGYSSSELRHWASLIRELATAGDLSTPRPAYIYFDNDADGRAPFDALALADTLAG